MRSVYQWIPLLLALALLAGCGGAGGLMQGSYLKEHEAELTIPADVDGEPVRFEVAPGTPAQVIGANLAKAGIIRDEQLFEAYVRVNELHTRLEAGTFVLSPAMTLVEIVEELQNALAAGVVVLIPEGWRLEQTADYLTRANVFSDTVDSRSAQSELYRSVGLSGDLSLLPGAEFPFLEQRPDGASLEGYLFPDTYELDKETPLAAELLAAQLRNFAARVLPLYDAALAAGSTALSLHEVITLASVVEREAVVAAERPTIAGVYLNRMKNGIRLEADPTVQYAMGYQPAADQWWKTPVTLEEYAAVLSPYNTYLNSGLPPGPIASPGLSSIQAVLQPEAHDYLYFVALPDESGAHLFAQTFDEHLVNVQRYRSGQ